MPEWLIIAVAIIGIVLIMLVFAFLDLVKGIARAVLAGAFVFILILVVNRFLTPRTSEPFPDQAVPPREFPAPDSDDFDNLSEFFRELGEDVDRWIAGESGQPGVGDRPYEGTRPGDLLYPVPEQRTDPGRIAEQPAANSPSRSAQPASRQTQPPVPAMW